PYLPVGEQLRSGTRDARDPVCRSTKMATQLLVFLLGPEDQISVQFAHCRVKRRAIISPVVLDPASDNWIEHSRQILDRFITALRSFQLRNLSRIAFAAWFDTAGLKLMKNFPLRFIELLGRNV